MKCIKPPKRPILNIATLIGVFSATIECHPKMNCISGGPHIYVAQRLIQSLSTQLHIHLSKGKRAYNIGQVVGICLLSYIVTYRPAREQCCWDSRLLHAGQ